MRREPYGIGSIVHVVKRGARGFVFLKDDQDRNRLLLQMRHFNDASVSPNWYRDLLDENKNQTFERASIWGEQKQLVRIHAFCLHNNHLHFLLEEIIDEGISDFMHKLGVGISGYLNERYTEHGSPFQGPYKSKTVDTDTYLRYVIAYIIVKNAFEQFPGGYEEAARHFDKAYQWLLQFPYGSLTDLDCLWRSDLHKRDIVYGDLVTTMWTPEEFKIFAHDVIDGRAHLGTEDKHAFSGAFI